eukprot:2456195-Amphidinium_carterae.1
MLRAHAEAQKSASQGLAKWACWAKEAVQGGASSAHKWSKRAQMPADIVDELGEPVADEASLRTIERFWWSVWAKTSAPAE